MLVVQSAWTTKNGFICGMTLVGRACTMCIIHWVMTRKRRVDDGDDGERELDEMNDGGASC
jgi:hypothetical protein